MASNVDLISHLAGLARDAGREPAMPGEAREILDIGWSPASGEGFTPRDSRL